MPLWHKAQGSMAGLGRRLARVDAQLFRLHHFPAADGADCQGLRRAADRGRHRLHLDLVDAGLSAPPPPGWLADQIGRKKPLMISIAWFSVCNPRARRHCLAASRPRPVAPVRRPRAELLVAVAVSHRARHRHRCGMAPCRRGAGDGNMAATLARLHGFGAAGAPGAFAGTAIQRRLRSAL